MKDDLSEQTYISSKEHVHCFDSSYNINNFDWNYNSKGFVLLFSVLIFRTNKNSCHVLYTSRSLAPQKNLSIDISLQCPEQNKVTLGRTEPKRTENVMSWKECSSLCREKSDCKYWTWYDRNNRIPRGDSNLCLTMTNARNVRNKSNTWSGTRECGGEIFIFFILIIGHCF